MSFAIYLSAFKAFISVEKSKFKKKKIKRHKKFLTLVRRTICNFHII